MSISKYCSDYLRQSFQQQTGQKLKATHSRELIAAFFGYKSHAALLATSQDFFSELKHIEILKPDEKLVEQRCRNLNQVPSALSTFNVINIIANYLLANKFYEGKFCINQSLEEYISVVYLHDEVLNIEDQLASEMASTNAIYNEMDINSYNLAQIDDHHISVISEGTFYGDHDNERMFSGDQINFIVNTSLRRIGHIGFSVEDCDVSGQVEDDWRDMEYYETVLLDDGFTLD